MKLLILVGISGSGKTTYAKNLEKLGYARVSYDECIYQHSCKIPDERCFWNAIVAQLNMGKNVAVDHLNLRIDQTLRLITIAEMYHANAEIVAFQISIDEALERLRLRNGHIQTESKTVQLLHQMDEMNSMLEMLNHMGIHYSMVDAKLYGVMCDVAGNFVKVSHELTAPTVRFCKSAF
jgi:predicted kinase